MKDRNKLMTISGKTRRKSKSYNRTWRNAFVVCVKGKRSHNKKSREIPLAVGKILAIRVIFGTSMKAPLMKAIKGAPNPSIFPTTSSFDMKALQMYTRNSENGKIVKAIKKPKNISPTGLNPNIKLLKNRIIVWPIITGIWIKIEPMI